MDQREGDRESLQAQAHIWNYIFSFFNSMSLKCIVELGVPEAIHKHGGHPVTLSQLVSALGIPPNRSAFICRLMRLLTHAGFFTVQRNSDGEEAFLLTNASQHLLPDNPHSVSPFVLVMLDATMLRPWECLSAWLRGSSPSPFHHVHGVSFWEAATQTPGLNGLFKEAMANDSRLMMDIAIKDQRGVFQGLKSLVDVGGGSGAAAMSLANAFPQLKCTVLELPHVVASAPKGTAVDFVAGDMFKYIPPADAVLLKWVLHTWSDQDCVKLLKLCKQAIPPKEEGGKVIIMEMVVSDDLRCHELRETQYLYDLMMVAYTDDGKERDEAEWRKLFSDAGFSGYKISALGCRAIIELYP